VWVCLKTRALLLLLLVLVSMTLVLSAPTSASQPDLVVLDVAREVHLQEYGLILTNDTFTVKNVGVEAASYVLAAFPLAEFSHVQYFCAQTEAGAPLLSQRVPLVGSNCTGWRIYVPEPIMPDRNFTLTTRMVLEGLTSIPDSTEVLCNFSSIPTSPYLIKHCSTTISYHAGVTDPSQTSIISTDVQPYGYRPTVVQFGIASSNAKPLITYLELTRQFSVTQWGYLQVLETHTLQVDSINPDTFLWSGPPTSSGTTTGINLVLPPGGQLLRAYDSLADLNWTMPSPPSLTSPGTLNVRPQFKLNQGDVYQFFIEYRCPLDIRQLVSQNGFVLSLNPYYEHPWIIRHQVTEIILPSGSQLFALPERAEVTILPTTQYVLRFDAYNVTSLSQSELTASYVYPLQPALARPVFIALVFGLISLAYVGVRRIPGIREEEKVIAAPVMVDSTALGEFCALYGEKVALLLQTERLEQSMLARKIPMPRYRKEVKEAERKLRALERDIQTRAHLLTEAGGRYAANVRQLELLEAERLGAIEAQRALEQRYRQKRITYEVYKKIQTDLEKRSNKAIAGMDRILLTLREEISK
jgi:hypothetical protein